ncbi:MAG: hypothetical protein JNK46_11830 [Methylobacteriaceae bacterium]|nr:hypothetical protein [Methylobacteriaceae bacterium]
MSGAPSPLDRLWALSRRLTEAGVSHETVVYRDDAVSIVANTPGRYWEIDFLDDGSVDVEIYESKGVEEKPLEAIEQLIASTGDDNPR